MDKSSAPECPTSPTGKHDLDTSMEAGPWNCFYCGVSMRGMGCEIYSWDGELVENNIRKGTGQ